MPEPEFEPTTFAPMFTNPALGLLWYAGDDWTRVGLLAHALDGAGVMYQAFLDMMEQIRPMFEPLMEPHHA